MPVTLSENTFILNHICELSVDIVFEDNKLDWDLFLLVLIC